MRLKILIPLFVVLMAGLCYFVFLKIENQPFAKLISAPVKNSSLRVNNALGTELDPSNISYIEHLNILKSNVSEIEKNILAVQTISNDQTAKITDPTIEYLKACVETNRSLIKFNQLNIRKSVLKKRMEGHFLDLKSTDPLVVESAATNGEKTVQEIKEFESEWTELGTEFFAVFYKLVANRKIISSYFSNDVLVNVEFVNRFNDQHYGQIKKP